MHFLLLPVISIIVFWILRNCRVKIFITNISYFWLNFSWLRHRILCMWFHDSLLISTTNIALILSLLHIYIPVFKHSVVWWHLILMLYFTVAWSWFWSFDSTWSCRALAWLLWSSLYVVTVLVRVSFNVSCIHWEVQVACMLAAWSLLYVVTALVHCCLLCLHVLLFLWCTWSFEPLCFGAVMLVQWYAWNWSLLPSLSYICVFAFSRCALTWVVAMCIRVCTDWSSSCIH